MEWCRKNNVPAADSKWWNNAEEKYNNRKI
jgi:hypothetical protein